MMVKNNITGNTKVKCGDFIFIDDLENRLSGLALVHREYIHHLTCSGFVTEITPGRGCGSAQSHRPRHPGASGVPPSAAPARRGRFATPSTWPAGCVVHAQTRDRNVRLTGEQHHGNAMLPVRLRIR